MSTIAPADGPSSTFRAARRKKAPAPGAARPARHDPGRAAALDAGGELLVTRGLVAVTLDAVAERSRINRRAIERWWPSEEALALDVLNHEWVALARQVLRGAHRSRL